MASYEAWLKQNIAAKSIVPKKKHHKKMSEFLAKQDKTKP